MNKLKIAIVIGTTRATRFGHKNRRPQGFPDAVL
jgi:hypothetical protein